MIRFIIIILVSGQSFSLESRNQTRMKYKKPYYVHGRTTMVQLFEWKWKDIAAECERFLGPKGFGGVQVSPPNENLKLKTRNRTWWERYQAVSYRLTTRSGNERQFSDMVQRCNNVGVRIYVDAVINHMTGTWHETVGTAGSKVNYDDWFYPSVPYNSYNFNWPYCVITKEDYICCPARVRNCELNGLRDLNLGTEYVRDKIVKYMNRLIQMCVAGFRIDSAKHMWPFDLKVIYNRLHDLNINCGFPSGARPFIYQEVIDFGEEAISRDEYSIIGAVTEFKFGMEVSRAFQGFTKLTFLQSLGPVWGFLPSYAAVTFIDNHDNQRGHCVKCFILTYKDAKRYKGAVAFMLAYPYGNPRVMSSYDFDDPDDGPPMGRDQQIKSPSIRRDGSCGKGWVCEHRWPPIYRMIAFRNEAKNTKFNDWWDNGANQIAFCRGTAGFVAFNNDDKMDLYQNLQTCLPPGTYCDVISGYNKNNKCTGKKVIVSGDGIATISIKTTEQDMVLAIHVGKDSRL